LWWFDSASWGCGHGCRSPIFNNVFSVLQINIRGRINGVRVLHSIGQSINPEITPPVFRE
jgi:hypothetical protein